MSDEVEDLRPGFLMRVPKREVTLLTLIEDALARGDALDKIDRLFDMRDREEKRNALRAFDRAIAAAKAAIPTILKNRKVGFESKKTGDRTSYRHADLAEIERTLRKPLADEGLSYRFRSDVKDGQIVVTCIIAHEEGHREENSLPGPADTSGSKNPIQAIGSTTTYLSRYTLMLSLGLAASEDDDTAMLDNAPVDDEQLKTLWERIKKSGINEARFLKKFEIEMVANLPARRFDEALAAIGTYESEKVRRQVEQLNAERDAADA
jgi:ERF superfamily